MMKITASRNWLLLMVYILFSLSCGKKTPEPSISVPAISTTAATLIGLNEATVGLTVNSSGNSAIIEKGICYNTSAMPTITNNKMTVASANVSINFSMNLIGLTSNTTYYARAYAINAKGTAYGNEVVFTTINPIHIGGMYGGGMVYFIDNTGKHGLIVAPFDQSNAASWGCKGIDIPGTANQSIGYGLANTKAILNACKENGTGAALCDNLVVDGFDDWYLPSVNEIKEMKVLFDKGLTSQIKLNSGAGYMSSNQDYRMINGVIAPENNIVIYVFKSNGDFISSTTKDDAVMPFVRAVRSF